MTPITRRESLFSTTGSQSTLCLCIGSATGIGDWSGMTIMGVGEHKVLDFSRWSSGMLVEYAAGVFIRVMRCEPVGWDRFYEH